MLIPQTFEPKPVKSDQMKLGGAGKKNEEEERERERERERQTDRQRRTETERETDRGNNSLCAVWLVFTGPGLLKQPEEPCLSLSRLAFQKRVQWQDAAATEAQTPEQATRSFS